MKFYKICAALSAACLALFPAAAYTFAEDYSDYSEDGGGEIYYYDDSDSGSYGDSGGTIEYYDDSGYDGSYEEDAGGSGEIYISTEDFYSEDSSDETDVTPVPEDSSEEGDEEAAPEETEEITPFDPENIVQGKIITNDIEGWPDGPAIECASAFLIEESTGTVLYSSDADRIYYPSSPVKIMTCLLALENCSLDEEVTFTQTGVSGATDGATNIAAQVDEVFTVEQCLYAIMLASANDASLQIAEHVGGTVEHFVEMMNEKAAEIGCTGTVFTNPTGLADEAQHSTAHDLALIMETAMQNEDFAKIASATTYTIPATNLSGGDRNLRTGFTMNDPGSGGYYQGCLAGKEGYTSESGSVLVCAAERDDMRLYCAVMRGDAETTDVQAAALLDYGFTFFELRDLGSRDFSVMEGGNVCAPVTVSNDEIEITDTLLTEDNEYDRQYSVGGAPIGKATALIVEEKEDAAIADGEKNMEEALEASGKQNIIPYILIIAAGLALSGYVVSRIVKVAKR